MRADEVSRTDAERDALAALRDATGEQDGAMERHCLRAFLIADRIASARDIAVDREALLVAGLLHDVGLYDAASSGGVYVSEGAEFTAAILRRHGWDEKRIALCADTVERHHELRPQWERGDEVELLRRADLVDLSAGLIRFGLPRDWLRDLFRSVPRDGAYRMLAHQVGKALRERPLTMPRIFLRGG